MKQEFCRLLMSVQMVGNSIPLLCNQENFILRANSYKINKALPGYHAIIKPAVKNNLDNGRPRNGMFVAIPNSFKNIIEDVSPNFWRLQAVLIKCSNSSLLVINSYFPVDPRTNRFDDSELLEIFQHIRSILHNNEFSNILWCGDINSDFIRNTGFVIKVKEFIDEFSFDASWNLFNIDYTHHHEVNNQSYTSTIDHFLWNRELREKIIDCGVLHHPSNWSDHSPVYCKIDTESIEIENVIERALPPPKPSWKKSDDHQKDNFVKKLDSILSAIEVNDEFSNCTDVHCKDAEHINAADELILTILDSVDKAASETLHKANQSDPTKPKKIPVPGWSVFVKPFKDNAYFWHQVWRSAGRPINTELHRIMKHTRNVYHYQCKKCKKSENAVRRNKLLDACLNGNGDLFKEIKKMRSSKPVVATSMDGEKQNVEDHFKHIYDNLYNSVDDKENMTELFENVNNDTNYTHLHDVQKVTPDIVKEAAKHLKDGKSDPTHLFSSDCFKNGPDSLFHLLSVVMKGFLVHAHITIYLLLATLVPIVKDKLASLSSSKNYRSIAISSLFLKIFDWVILILFGVNICLDELQFAYQEGSSTTMCTWAVIETIGYFLRNGSEVFTCQTDMTKAFDLVQHSLLFQKLLSEGLSKIFVRMLMVIYNTCSNRQMFAGMDSFQTFSVYAMESVKERFLVEISTAAQ